jgi:phosphatidylethanolamine/phosphatidyl-N-methylethanolamine N-methyltransferase
MRFQMHTNTWNRIRYTLAIPFYSWLVKRFRADRQTSINLLQLKLGEHVLILGCGPGLDLPFIPRGVQITAIDITPLMVYQTKKEALRLWLNPDVHVMDGQALEFADATFDAVILHLILAVIPDPFACIRETERVLKPGGRVTIFDKFLDANTKPTLSRKILNLFTSFVFSDINRQVEPILATTHLQTEYIQASAVWKKLGYKIVLARKP